MQQRRHDRGIHAAGKTQHHLVLSDLGAHGRDHALDDVARGPQRTATANVVYEALQNGAPLGGVRNFEMELHAVETTGLVRNTRKRRVIGGGNDFESGRQLCDTVAMAHPHVQPFGAAVILLVAQVVKELRVAVHAYARVAEFALVRAFDLPAELRRHGLLAIADAEDRDLHVEDLLRCARGFRLRNRLRTARENDAARREFFYFLD